MKKWLKHIKFKKLLLFILVLFVVGFLFGIIYYLILDSEVKKNITLNLITLKDNLSVSRINNILLHFSILIALLVLAFTIIGVPLIYFYIFYEGISLGFSFSFVIAIFGLKGIVFCLLYFIFYKLFYYIYIVLITLRCTRISKNVLGLFIYRGNSVLKRNLSINLKKVFLFILFIFLYDVLIYFISLNINNILINFL